MIRIAIFSTEADAKAYSDKIHAYLQANRPGYNAVKWADPIQSADGTQWTVKQPIEEEVQKWEIPINTENEKAKAVGITEDLPESGQVIEGKFYLYKGDVLRCRQTHDRTIYEPKDTPALFSYFRDNTDQLQWISGEQVEIGWIRFYNGIKYVVVLAHQTQDDWTPDKATTLWDEYSEPIPDVKPPQWNTNDWGKYIVGYKVYDSGKIWEAINTTHTWIQPALTGNGAISWKFIKDWID